MLLVAGCILSVNSFFSNRTVLFQQINALTEVTTLAVTASLMFDNKADVQQTLETLKAHKNMVYTAVLKTRQQKPFAFVRQEGNWQIPEELTTFFNDCQPHKFSLTFLRICKPLVYDGVSFGKIVMIISLHTIYQRLLEDLIVVFIGLILASVLIFIIIEKFANKLTTPILELLEISEQVSQSGKYDLRAKIQSTDEIGRLGQAFNFMLEKIQYWHNALTDQKNRLEEIVEERTQDLIETKNQALALADRAEKTSMAKSEFLSVMSHEIRTPLNAIIGFTDLLKDTQLGDEQNKYINIINQSGNSLLTQINDILDFSKIEAGKMELDPTWFDMYELLITVLAGNCFESSRKSLYLKHQIANDLPRYCYGDENKIRQILYNLLNNAVKFTERGFISLTVNTEERSQDLGVMVFSIVDTGIGISKNDQEVLFDPFIQVDASETRTQGGTGLGLAIVKKLVALLNGDIFIHSVEGKGTEFTLRLPLKLIVSESDNSQIDFPLIALFEDKVDSTFAQQLKQLGYKVETIDSTNRLLFEQKPLLTEKYQLLIFNQECLDHALFWHRRVLSGQKISVAYCTNNNQSISDLSDMPMISMGHDVLDMVEQINRLIKTEFSMISSKEIRQELNILVVEDNPINLMMTQKMLTKTGLQIFTATNGKEAIESYQSNNKLGLILMDCQMPVMDGYSATREIRLLEKNKDKHIPIIALTANAFDEDRKVCFAAGMDDFLSKPFKIKQLLKRVDHWLKVVSEGKKATIPTQMYNQLNQEVLDAGIIKELMELDESGSKKFISQISAIFFTNAEQLMHKIEIAFAEKMIDIIAKSAHQLKSSSMNVAAKSLSDLFSQLESAAKEDNYPLCIKLWEPIVEEYQQVGLAFKDYLKD